MHPFFRNKKTYLEKGKEPREKGINPKIRTTSESGKHWNIMLTLISTWTQFTSTIVRRYRSESIKDYNNISITENFIRTRS